MEKVAPAIAKPAMSPAAERGVSLSPASENLIQRDLAVQPTNTPAAAPQLTAKQIRDAIDFNNERYNKESIEEIQDIVGGPKSGIMVKETVELIALYQFENSMAKIDGMVGADTFKLLTTELAAENVSQDTCITMFNVETGGPMEMHPAAIANQANIFGHFEVEILFSPHCDCSRFEYRQFICGNVTHNGNNINANFAVPGGLPAIGAWREDGNINLANNGRYGHRSDLPSQGITNQYTQPDMATGCRFNSVDEPGVASGPANAGDVYVFDFRFMGDIMKDGQRIERKFWAVQDTVTIPI